MIALLNLWNIVAAALWYRFLARRIRYTADKQSKGLLVGFFFAGVLSVLVTLMASYLHPVHWFFPIVYESEFFYQVLVTGIVEEWAKWLCFVMAVQGGGTIKEPQDGILQGAAVGLGFGAVENILYFYAYPEIFIAIRPILTTGGHMIYGAFWGASYSAAVYANSYGKDPQAYRLAVGSIFFAALVHGTYNSLLFTPWPLAALLPKALLLLLSILAFFRLVNHSPYRRYSYDQAEEAIAAIRRGIAFNRRSTILNRRLALFLMHLGRYKEAARAFAAATPRAKNRRALRFFKGVCEYAHLGGSLGKSSLRKAWAALSDSEREQLTRELKRVLSRDRELYEGVARFVNTPFSEGRGKSGQGLAKELKQRKARRRRLASSGRRGFEQELAGLSEDERERLARKWGKR